MPHVFISYAKKDTRSLAEELFRTLNSIPGLTAWMDTSLEADESWAFQIQQEIDQAAYVVVLLSPDVNRPITATQRRSFVLNEIDYAQQDNKPILPVMVQRTKQPVQLAGIQYLDLTSTPTNPDPVVDRVCQRFNLESPRQREEREQREAAQHQQAELDRQRLEQEQREAAYRKQAELDSQRREQAARVQPPPVSAPPVSPSRSEPANQPSVLPASPAYQRPSESDQQNVSQLTRLRKWLRRGIIAAGVIVVVILTGFILYRISPPVLLALARTRVEGVTRNADWTPVEQEFDGIPMVLVPEGCFLMGSFDRIDEQPVVPQCIEEHFWLDKYEVTNAVYGSTGSTTSDCTRRSSEPDQPRICISWFDARDFCESRGGRLPTEPEWEFAAGGPDGLVYPWGNDFMAENVVYGSNSGSKTAPVGSRPGGISWVGALDLSGNVYEWVSSLYVFYPYDREKAEYTESTNDNPVTRGGSWSDYEDYWLRTNNRYSGVNEYDNVGFRCARNYE